MNNYKISRRNRFITAVKRIVVVLVIFVSNTKNRLYKQNNSARASHFLGTCTFLYRSLNN